MEKLNVFGSHGQHHEQKKEEDLTTLLSEAERTELVHLVARAIGSMRTSIESNFRSSQIGHVSGSAGHGSLGDSSGSTSDQPKASTASAEGIEKERPASELKELESALLAFFDDWRHAVNTRLGEAVHLQGLESHSDGGQPGPEDPDGGSLAGESARPHYRQIHTALAATDEGKRRFILHSVLLLVLSLEHYTAYSRVLMMYLTNSLNLNLGVLEEDEKKVAYGLLEAAKEMSGDEAAKGRAEENKGSRRWKVGLASVAGAALVGVTGGLAAPLVAAGIGGVMGGLGLGATAAAGYLGTLAGSSVIVGGLFGAYGGRMTGQMVDRYAREVEDFAFLPVHERRKGWDDPREASPEDRRLRVMIGISGWLTEQDDAVRPWRVLGHGSAEVFALRYELEALLGLGNALTSMVKTAAWNYAMSEIIKHTIFASLSAALWPLGLLKVGRLVDNPFSIAKVRSDKAGKVLADALINRAQGERPVTLIGYSLGARVIYSCLLSLAERRAFGLIENAVLLGTPTPSDSTDWAMLRSVVAGRLINGYSENDYILGFLYRTSSIQLGVAGLQKIEGVPGVENIDVSASVSGHLRYRYAVGRMLRDNVFLDRASADVDEEEVRRQEETLGELDREEEEEARRRQQQNPNDGSKAAANDADDDEMHEEEARKTEEEIRRKNQATMPKPASQDAAASTTAAAAQGPDPGPDPGAGAGAGPA